jgi:hypothetical protein
MKFHPLSLTLGESNPSSVASYNVQIRDSDGVTAVAALSGVPGNPSGTTVIPLGDAGGCITNSLTGRQVKVFVQEVGPAGDLSPFVIVKDSSNNDTFTVNPIPDGAESAVVNP